MKLEIKKTLLTVSLTATVVLATAGTTPNLKRTNDMDGNPLMRPSGLPYGAPDFNKIKSAHYLPAIEAGIEEQREEIRNIVSNRSKPNFVNTILAYEQSGLLLDRASSIFFSLTSAHKTPEIAEMEKKAMELITDFGNEVIFNQKLFQRIKFVYDHEYKSLQGENKKLLEEVYKKFVRSGALLSKEKMARMEQINKRLATLQQDFNNMLPNSTNNAAVWVDNESELAGLSAADIAQCKKDAESRGGKAPYLSLIHI